MFHIRDTGKKRLKRLIEEGCDWLWQDPAEINGAKMAEVWWQQAFLILLLFHAATHAFA